MLKNPPKLVFDRVRLGGEVTVNVSALVSLPLLLLVTEIVPVVAEVGTVAVIWVPPPVTLAVAVTPLNLTKGVVPKLWPEIVTVDPAVPEIGLTELITVGVFGPNPVSFTFLRYRATDVGREEKNRKPVFASICSTVVI